MTVPRPFHQPCIAWPYGVPVRSCIVRACQGGAVTVGGKGKGEANSSRDHNHLRTRPNPTLLMEGRRALMSPTTIPCEICEIARSFCEIILSWAFCKPHPGPCFQLPFLATTCFSSAGPRETQSHGDGKAVWG